MLRENLQNALKEAMKNHDTATVSAVRLIIAGQKEKDVAARGAGKECASDADLLSMMQGMIKQRNESIKIYTEGGRPELAAKEQAEISVIERFLPKQLSEAETKAAIEAAIAKTGAAGMKDMGKVMAELKAAYAGQLDMGKASGMIKSLLGKRAPRYPPPPSPARAACRRGFLFSAVSGKSGRPGVFLLRRFRKAAAAPNG